VGLNQPQEGCALSYFVMPGRASAGYFPPQVVSGRGHGAQGILEQTQLQTSAAELCHMQQSMKLMQKKPQALQGNLQPWDGSRLDGLKGLFICSWTQ